MLCPPVQLAHAADELGCHVVCKGAPRLRVGQHTARHADARG
jgi:hypothetical protein